MLSSVVMGVVHNEQRLSTADRAAAIANLGEAADKRYSLGLNGIFVEK